MGFVDKKIRIENSFFNEPTRKRFSTGITGSGTFSITNEKKGYFHGSSYVGKIFDKKCEKVYFIIESGK